MHSTSTPRPSLSPIPPTHFAFAERATNLVVLVRPRGSTTYPSRAQNPRPSHSRMVHRVCRPPPDSLPTWALDAYPRLPGPDFGVLPTPSPELDYAPEVVAVHDRNQMYRAQQQLPSWEVLAEDVPSRNIPASGTKRSYDYTVDDFFTDVKKRRVNPAYDSRTYIAFYSRKNSQILTHLS